MLISATVTAQDWYAVTDPLDADEPVARISSPGDSADIVVADVTEPAAILGQATDSHYSYDAAGRLAPIRHQKADGSALAQYSYQRDAKAGWPAPRKKSAARARVKPRTEAGRYDAAAMAPGCVQAGYTAMKAQASRTP